MPVLHKGNYEDADKPLQQHGVFQFVSDPRDSQKTYLEPSPHPSLEPRQPEVSLTKTEFLTDGWRNSPNEHTYLKFSSNSYQVITCYS